MRGGPQVLNVEVALAVEHLGVPKHDCVARGCAGRIDCQFDPADNVLAEVEHGVAIRCPEDLDRLDFLDPADRRTGRRDEAHLRPLKQTDRLPRCGGIAGQRPTGAFEPRVVDLTHVDVRHPDWSGRGPPLLVSPEDIDLPILVLDPNLQK